MSDRAAVVRALLDVGAVTVRTDPLYVFASGLRSPIYTDNRRLASHPAQRAIVLAAFERLARAWSPPAGCMAGVATGGIPWAAWLSERLSLPLIYVRSAPKERGLEKQIEGDPAVCRDAIVVEDLVTTGTSSVRAVDVLRAGGVSVAGVASVFSYGLPFAERLFRERDTTFASVVGIADLIDVLRERASPSEVEAIERWRGDLASFTPQE